jgi:excisionase family DNA binding protein
MPRANREAGDEKLARLFERFDHQMISPGGAAHLLGLSRKTVHMLCKNGELTAYRSDELVNKTTPVWVYIPLRDVYAYAEKVGRVLPGMKNT